MKKSIRYLHQSLWMAISTLAPFPLFAQAAETAIKQATYISQPTLWTGPSLWDSGFAIEIEINSLGSYRAYDTTVKSIQKYQIGEYTSKLPKVRAAEWGYTVLNLATGQMDGSGRIINNIYLDNLNNINTRPQALSKMMEFVKQQYGCQESWYSMNGHHCWHHYAGAEGATVLASEIGENIHGYQLHMAMNRGAAKQYNLPWAIDFSSWHGAGILDYSTHAVWPGYSSIQNGHSTSLVERSMLMSYMAGADAVVAEAGGTIAFYEEKTADGTYGLTPYGEVFQQLNAFAKAHGRGIAYTPVAILLNRYHGMDRQPGEQKAFGKFAYNDGDRSTFDLIEKIWPGTFSVEKNGNEVGTMVNSAFPDMFDFLLQDAPLDLLKTYKVVLLSGTVTLSEAERNALKTYAEQGGTVLVDADNFTSFSLGPVGVGSIQKEKHGSGYIVGYKISALNEIMAEYFHYDVPFTLSTPIEYLVNVKDGAFYVTLINNEGITKRATTLPVIDQSKTKTVTVAYTGKATLNSIKEIWRGRSIHIDHHSVEIKLKPGEAAVLEFSHLPVSAL